MVRRRSLEQALTAALQRSRVVVLIGQRQCGKTTLARQHLEETSPNYFDLEDPASIARLAWRRNFVQTLLERDLPQWGVRVPASALLRFWTMLAHYHGQTWSAAEPARALGVSENTVRRYLDLLTDAFMIRQLQPWHANIGKRQVKSPKVYVRDSGVLHYLLGIPTAKALFEHPKVGASWEGFVIEQVLATQPHDEAHFWATHQGAEIDLVLRIGRHLVGIECKRADAPTMTPSIRIAREDLGLARVIVLYPGTRTYPIAEGVEAVPVARLAEGTPLFPEMLD